MTVNALRKCLDLPTFVEKGSARLRLTTHESEKKRIYVMEKSEHLRKPANDEVVMILAAVQQPVIKLMNVQHRATVHTIQSEISRVASEVNICLGFRHLACQSPGLPRLRWVCPYLSLQSKSLGTSS